MKRAVLVVVGMAALAACGGSGSGSGSSASPVLNGQETRPPNQVVGSASNALAAASAVHVAGDFSVGGKPGQIDFQLQGTDAQGSETVQNVRVDVVETGGSLYLKAPATFWSSNGAGAAAPQLADKFVKIPEARAASFNTPNTKLLADQIAKSVNSLQPGTTRGDVNGQPAIIVTQKDGSQLYVANIGDPVPLRIVNKGTTPGTLNFTDYGKTQQITAPPGAVPLPSSGGSTTGA